METYKSMKKPFKANDRKFNLKFLVAGNSGCGKTHLFANYILGPVHFYMLDKGGEKTIEKLISDRDQNAPVLSVDNFSSAEISFSDFWTAFQQDEKDGFFDYLAENNGLLVIDSITNANKKAINEICKRSGVTPSGIGKTLDMKKGMAPPHWGQLLNWMSTLVGALQELPCATASTVHLHTLLNSDQEVVARYPSVNGQFRQLIAVDYDEAYLLETRGENHLIHFKERLKFEAKSRVFSMKEVRNITINDLAKAYLAGETIIKGGK